METNARLYTKIMRYIENNFYSGSWDFITLASAHPQLANILGNILVDNKIVDSYSDLYKHYLPARI